MGEANMNHLMAAWIFSGVLGYLYWPWRYSYAMSDDDLFDLLRNAWIEIPACLLGGPLAFGLMFPL